jgi:hypothetical protein
VFEANWPNNEAEDDSRLPPELTPVTGPLCPTLCIASPLPPPRHNVFVFYNNLGKGSGARQSSNRNEENPVLTGMEKISFMLKTIVFQMVIDIQLI